MRLDVKLPKEPNVRTFFCTRACTDANWCDVARVSINILPDVALLEIFDFYIGGKDQYFDAEEQKIHTWLTLVHVCRKWRRIAFGSARRLGIRIWYKADLPLEEQLDIWPPLPIAIWADSGRSHYDDNNIIAALEHNYRVSRIELWDISCLEMENVLAAMHRPFPALTYLRLALDVHEHFTVSPLPVIPDSFLGGSAPHLESLNLRYIPFLGLPKLLLSATRLVELFLPRIPHSAYFPPEVLVNCLSVLTRLEILDLGFDEYIPSRVDQNSRYPPSPIRIHLPVFNELLFRGASKYLDDLVACIDVPLLDTLKITFFHEPMIDTPQLTQFIIRTPKFTTPFAARVVFSGWEVSVSMPLPQTDYSIAPLKLGISGKRTDLQLSSLARVCGSSFPQNFIPAVKYLDIIWREGSDTVENSQWQELLRLFTAVKGLYISQEAVSRIAPALKVLGERVTEMLPALETLTLYESTSGPDQEGIIQFVSARQLAGHPISISYGSSHIGFY